MIWGLEQVERRVVRALRFVDAETRQPVERSLAVSAPAGVRLVRNRSGVHVITEAPGLAAWTTSFDQPPDSPPAESTAIEFSVEDPQRRYVARRFTIKAPPGRPAPLFTAVDVPLYPSPSARPSPGSAVLRFSVEGADERPRGGVLLAVRVPIAPGLTLVERGVTDPQGEALVLVPGIPAVAWGQTDDGALVYPAFEATVQAAFHADEPWPPDPDLLAPDLADLPGTIAVACGRESHHRLSLS